MARLFKTVLLLQAISQRIVGVELLRPNEMNVDLAFSGTDWSKGKGKSIAEKLCRDGLLFKKPVGGGKMEYTVANSTGDAATIEKKKQEVINETRTQNLVVNADLMSAIQLPASIKGRFELEAATANNIGAILSKSIQNLKPNRFKAIVTYAVMAVIEGMDANEAKRYLCDLISDFPSVGMTIIINQKK